jgi:hypothetical protein
MSNCKSCGGCGKDLTMTPQEIQVLYKFAQFPFLPVARRIDDTSPVFLEDNDYAPEQYSLILGLLERKGLITIDFDIPLKNTDISIYASYPIVGSMALTARGQQVLELLDLQGASE